MSGWGIREQWNATRHFTHKMWRDESFLHQLSENGSLLLDENCDKIYLVALSKIMKFENRVSWSFASDVLRKLPSHQARRILWLASYRWWVETTRRREAALAAFSEVGLDGAFDNDISLAEEEATLKMREKQLRALRWCYKDRTPDFDPIPVVERREDGMRRQRPRTLRV